MKWGCGGCKQGAPDRTALRNRLLDEVMSPLIRTWQQKEGWHLHMCRPLPWTIKAGPAGGLMASDGPTLWHVQISFS